MFIITVFLRDIAYNPVLGYKEIGAAIDVGKKIRDALKEPATACVQIEDEYGQTVNFWGTDYVAHTITDTEKQRPFNVEQKVDSLKTQQAFNTMLRADPTLQFFVGTDMTAPGVRR